MGGWTYILRCSDDSLYVGSTSYDDVTVRVMEHNAARYVGYTAARRPVTLIWSKRFDELTQAHAIERQLKGWSRAKKLALIAGDLDLVKNLSRRRAGKPRLPQKHTRRQLLQDFNSLGARHPEVRAAKRASPEG
jgi:putative endonuclease